MNAAAQETAQVLDRDLAQLRGEVEAYPDDASLWRLHPGILKRHVPITPSAHGLGRLVDAMPL